MQSATPWQSQTVSALAVRTTSWGTALAYLTGRDEALVDRCDARSAAPDRVEEPEALGHVDPLGDPGLTVVSGPDGASYPPESI
jgi:hypothetical protein